MNVYEIAFITENEDKPLQKNVEDIIGKFDGKVTQKDQWGDRQFAYRIKNLTHGFYHMWNFTIDGSRLKELKNRLNIEDGVVRYLIIKVD